jgi:hypothetical protein
MPGSAWDWRLDDEADLGDLRKVFGADRGSAPEPVISSQDNRDADDSPTPAARPVQPSASSGRKAFRPESFC